MHLTILTGASQHARHISLGYQLMTTAERNTAFSSLVKRNLLTEVNVDQNDEQNFHPWRHDQAGFWIIARINDNGIRALGIDPNRNDAPRVGA